MKTHWHLCFFIHCNRHMNTCTRTQLNERVTELEGEKEGKKIRKYQLGSWDKSANRHQGVGGGKCLCVCVCVYLYVFVFVRLGVRRRLTRTAVSKFMLFSWFYTFITCWRQLSRLCCIFVQFCAWNLRKDVMYVYSISLVLDLILTAYIFLCLESRLDH